MKHTNTNHKHSDSNSREQSKQRGGIKLLKKKKKQKKKKKKKKKNTLTPCPSNSQCCVVAPACAWRERGGEQGALAKSKTEGENNGRLVAGATSDDKTEQNRTATNKKRRKGRDASVLLSSRFWW